HRRTESTQTGAESEYASSSSANGSRVVRSDGRRRRRGKDANISSSQAMESRAADDLTSPPGLTPTSLLMGWQRSFASNRQGRPWRRSTWGEDGEASAPSQLRRTFGSRRRAAPR